LLNWYRHGGTPWDDFDSMTTIYWGIPQQFPKTR
jgi:hypothetical protein